MKRNISEDLPARKFAPAASTGGGSAVGGGGDMEKKARAAIHDSKYRVKKDMGPDTHLDPAAFIQAVIKKLRNSQYDLPIKTRAIQIVKGDTQVKEIKEFASQNVARALYSVFVEQPSKIIDEEYIEKLKEELSNEYQNPEQRKYMYRVTDKLTGNSYVTKKTRSEANKLRVNPNISSVEMVDKREADQRQESERTRGAQTASVAAGKGLKNNDGDLANNYPPYNAVSRGDIIAGATGKDQMGGKRKVKEEFIGEKDNNKSKKKPVEPMKPGETNKCEVYGSPGSRKQDDLTMHQELEGEMIAETGYSKFLKKVHSLQEKAVSQNQQQLAAMALEYLNGNMPDASDAVKQMAKMGRKELKKFARTSHKGLPEKVKVEEEMDYDDKKKKSEEETCEDDPRSNKTRDNLRRNYLRAMGLKMSYEPEGDVIDEEMPKKVKGKKLSGTRTFTGMGYYGRRANEKKDPKSMKPIFPGPRENQSPDGGDDKNHPSLPPSQRNRRPGYS
jgi:hypothetical protein